MVAFPGVTRRPLAALVPSVAVCALAALTTTAAAPRAFAGDEDDRAAQALFDRAETERGAMELARAADDYEAAAARSPSFRDGPRARIEAWRLRTHGEGDFVPLARLERVRRDPAVASDPAALAELASLADAWPAGPVRVEARTLVAEAYLGRLDRRRDAVPILRRVVDDPAADALTVAHARSELVAALLDEGDGDGARAVASAKGAEPGLASSVRKVVVRRRLHLASVATLGAFVVIAAIAVIGAARRGAFPAMTREVRALAGVTLAFAAWAAIGGGGLASAYESGNSLPFALLSAALVPLILAARAWSAVGRDQLAARVGRGVIAAASALAAAFLVLESLDPTYLTGFGL